MEVPTAVRIRMHPSLQALAFVIRAEDRFSARKEIEQEKAMPKNIYMVNQQLRTVPPMIRAFLQAHCCQTETRNSLSIEDNVQ